MIITKDSTHRVVFYMTDETDNETAETGLTVTVNISKNGGAFAAATNSVSEIANGFYYVDLTTTETNTAGPLIVRATATGANVWADIHHVEDVDATAARYADILLRRNFATVEGSTHGDTITTQSMIAALLRSIHSNVSGTTVTVYKTDNTSLGTYTITVDGSGNWTDIDI